MSWRYYFLQTRHVYLLGCKSKQELLFEGFEIPSAQANWQVGRLAVNKFGMCSLKGTYKGYSSSIMGISPVLY